MERLKRVLGIILCIAILTGCVPAGAATNKRCLFYGVTALDITYTNATISAYLTWNGVRPAQVGIISGRAQAP